MKAFNQKLFFTKKYNGKTVDLKTEVFCYKSAFQNLKNDRRKTWKYFAIVSRPCGTYESGIVNIYTTSTPGVFALVSYYDGSFYPLVSYSKLNKELIEAVKDYNAWRDSKNK